MPRSTRMRALVRGIALFVLVVLPSLSVMTRLAYYYFEGGSITFQQALLFVVESMTSTGYGELLPFHSWGMILFSVILIFGGFGILFVLFSTIATGYVQRMLGNSVPRQSPRGIRDHIVILTDDPISAQLAKLSEAAGLRHVVMSRDRDLVHSLLDLGVTAIQGEPSSVDDVTKAAVATARVVVTDQTDEQNVSSILAVRAVMQRVPIFSTVDDPHFSPYLEHAGADVALPVKRALGEALARWVIAPVSDALLATSREYPDLHFAEIPVTQACCTVGRTLKELRFRTRTGATVLGIWKADSYVRSAAASTTLESGTVAIVMASGEQLRRVHEEFGLIPKDLRRPRPGDRCIVAGGGHVGEQAARELREAGLDVAILDDRDVPLDGMVRGDATRAEGLLAAGIATASTLVVALNGDLKCLLATLVARSLNPDITIIARANREEYAERLMMAGADYAISLSSVASQRLMSLIAVNSCPLCSAELVAAKAQLAPQLGGQRLGDMRLFDECECLVAVADDGVDVMLNPRKEAIIPAGAVVTVLGEPERVALLLERMASLQVSSGG